MPVCLGACVCSYGRVGLRLLYTWSPSHTDVTLWVSGWVPCFRLVRCFGCGGLGVRLHQLPLIVNGSPANGNWELTMIEAMVRDRERPSASKRSIVRCLRVPVPSRFPAHGHPSRVPSAVRCAPRRGCGVSSNADGLCGVHGELHAAGARQHAVGPACALVLLQLRPRRRAPGPRAQGRRGLVRTDRVQRHHFGHLPGVCGGRVGMCCCCLCVFLCVVVCCCLCCCCCHSCCCYCCHCVSLFL